MGLDYNFYFQVNEGEQWTVPADFTNRWEYAAQLGYFTWFDDKDVTAKLFWGEQAIFAMRYDYPPYIENSILYQRTSAAWPEWFQGWLPFEDLMIDYWDETHLLVCKKIAASYALLFGDGKQPFPRDLLLNAGVDPHDLERLEDTSYYSQGRILNDPIDYLDGKTRYELERVPHPERLVEVSWKVTLSSFMGSWRLQDFRNLRQFGSDEAIRIICLFM